MQWRLQVKQRKRYLGAWIRGSSAGSLDLDGARVRRKSKQQCQVENVGMQMHSQNGGIKAHPFLNSESGLLYLYVPNFLTTPLIHATINLSFSLLGDLVRDGTRSTIWGCPRCV